MPDFSELQKRSHEISQGKGWWDNDDRSFGDFCALFHSEISEAFEAYRVSGTTSLSAGYSAEAIYTELADVVIRIMDFCESEGVQLSVVIQRKMDYNETRSHRHGGKAL